MFRRAILFFIAILLITEVAAQFPLTKRYTVADGLPMTELAWVAIDEYDYVWTTSTAGLISRFDGREFKQFFNDEGQPLNFDYLADLKGSVLAYNVEESSNIDNTILRGDSIIPLTQLPERVNFAQNFHDDQYLVFTTTDTLYFLDRVTLSIDSIEPLPPNDITGVFNRSVKLLPDGSLLVSEDHSKVRPRFRWPPGGTRFEPYDLDSIGLIVGKAGKGNYYYLRSAQKTLYVRDVNQALVNTFYSGLGGKFYFGTGINSSTYINGKESTYFIEILDSDKLQEGKIIRVYHLKTEGDDPLEFVFETIKSSENGTRFAASRDGTFWNVGHNGLTQIFPGSQLYRSGRDMVSSLHTFGELDDGTMYFGGYGTGFSRLDGKWPERVNNSTLTPATPVMPGRFKDESGQLVFLQENRAGGALIVLSPDEKIRKHEILNPNPNSRNLTGYGFEEVTLPGNAPIWNRSGEQARTSATKQLALSLVGTIPQKGLPPTGKIGFTDLPVANQPEFRFVGYDEGIRVRNILCTQQDVAGRIWFAHASTGMGFYDPALDTARTWAYERPGDPGAIAMVLDNWDRLWLGSLTGLKYIEGASALPFNHPLHLRSRQKELTIRDIPESYVNSLLLQHDTLIIGHDEGVTFLDLNNFEGNDTRAITLNTHEFGLGSTEQNALLIDQEGWLWVGADAGALRLDFRRFMRERRMQSSFKIILKDDRSDLHPYQDHKYELPLGDRTLKYGIQLPVADQISNQATADLILTNAYGDTISEDHFGVQSGMLFEKSYLEPGDYSLEVKLFQDNQLLEKKNVKIRIPLEVYKKPWVWFLIISVVGSLLIWGLWHRVRAARASLASEEMERKLQETLKEKESTQVSTLVNTINPHFLANAIQWMQSAVAIDRDKEDIYLIGHSLAHNMRAIFSKSMRRQASHALKDELKMVENYFRIVNIEYDQRFNFELPAEEDLGELGELPVFLLQLQIHAENAVERGLLNRSAGRKVVIRVKEDETNILLEIEDDGAGMTRSKRLQYKPDHQGSGLGTSILTRLQDIFNRRNEFEITTIVDTDLFDEPDGSGLKYGTKVTVTIPKKYSYDIESPRS